MHNERGAARRLHGKWRAGPGGLRFSPGWKRKRTRRVKKKKGAEKHRVGRATRNASVQKGHICCFGLAPEGRICCPGTQQIQPMSSRAECRLVLFARTSRAASARRGLRRGPAAAHPESRPKCVTAASSTRYRAHREGTERTADSHAVAPHTARRAGSAAEIQENDWKKGGKGAGQGGADLRLTTRRAALSAIRTTTAATAAAKLQAGRGGVRAGLCSFRKPPSVTSHVACTWRGVACRAGAQSLHRTEAFN